tara:strand:- start:738 stop:1055 length:318 start_codon:yes stop_codon:yes gene_type:complete
MKIPTNTKLWAISIESPQASSAFKKNNRLKGHPIRFPLLWDKDSKIAEKFGLLDPRYKEGSRDGIPYASTYVINKNGLVTFSHISLNYTKRPSSQKLLSELKKAN